MELEDDLPPEEGVADAIDAPVEDAPAEVVEDAPAPTVEDLANDMGWRPKDQWRGDPDKWKPAHEFLRATVDVNHKLGNKLKSFEEQLSTMARTSATLTERAVAQERQRILDARKEAIDMGDHAAVEAADEELRSLPKLESVNAPPPETQDFMARNTWFNQDQEATAWATNRAGELAKQGIGTARQLAIVEREAKGLFPELFPEPKPKAKAAPLTPPGSRGGKTAAKGFTALPADAQAAALDYEKRGICKRDEYAKLYFEEEA
jgi:hypothetical protein